MMTQREPVNLFLSYAQKDEPLLRKLETHLRLLERQRLISTWHNQQIVAGANWAKTIDEHLEQASIILLLVSPDFLASDYCYQVEMRRALELHEAGLAQVVPIILRPVDWKDAPFAHLQALPTDAKATTTWSNRDEAFVAVAKGIRKAIEALPLHTTSVPRATLPAAWNIPYGRNPFFTGRGEILSRLHSQFQQGQATALSQPQTISGIGGIGKTQVAIEYAYQYHQDYQAILWTRAGTHESLVSSYMEIARLLNLSQKDEQDQTCVVKAVLQWLGKQTQWLLILDNADDPYLLADFLPAHMSGHILITTRSHDFGELAIPVDLDPFDNETSAFFLLRRTHRLSLTTSLEQVGAAELALARDLAHELGELPLALDQAAAYIARTRCSLSQYLKLYRAHQMELLKIRGGIKPNHPESVVTTFDLSFKSAIQRNLAASDLLQLCALLASDAIPEELIIEGADHLGDNLKEVACNKLWFDELLGIVQSYSLLHRDGERKMLVMHRLVQVVILDGLNRHERRIWQERLVEVLAMEEVFPSPKFETWVRCERILPHVLRCLRELERENSTLLAMILLRAANYFHDRGRYAEAEPLYHRALHIYELKQGSHHVSVGSILNELAVLSVAQGRYTEAETLYQRALQIYKREQDSLSERGILSNFAALYGQQGHYGEAKELLQHAMQIDEEKELDFNHPLMLQMQNHEALLYMAEERYEEAERLLQRALQTEEQEFGSNHPSLLATLSNLANLYQSQERYEEAEQLYQRALQIGEQALGLKHHKVSQTLTCLAWLYRAQERYEEAERLLQRVLQTEEQEFGSNHYFVGITLSHMAILSIRQKHYEEAKQLLQRALPIYESSYGLDHDNTIALQQLYATLVRKMEEEEASFRWYVEQREEIVEKAFDTEQKLMEVNNQSKQAAVVAAVIIGFLGGCLFLMYFIFHLIPLFIFNSVCIILVSIIIVLSIIRKIIYYLRKRAIWAEWDAASAIENDTEVEEKDFDK